MKTLLVLVALAAVAAEPAFAQDPRAHSLAAQSGPLARPAPRPDARITVSVRGEGATSVWSVACEEASLEGLVRAIAKKGGLAVEGSELLAQAPPVTVELERRPLDQVLEYALGSAGLRHQLARGSLAILPDPAGAEKKELLALASAAWKHVADDARAGTGGAHGLERAKLAQGNLAELSGDLEGAYRVYAELAEDESSVEAAEALLRAGRILQRLGHWTEAAQHFRTLTGREAGAPFHAAARLELARSSIELGDPKSALYMLNALEASYPTRTSEDRVARSLVRARGGNETRDWLGALRSIEGVADDFSAADEHAALEIRAVALEGLGYAVEASRAWLLFAREGNAQEQSRAYEHAARIALELEDELGVLFVCREAAREGAGENLGPLMREARERLGLDQAERDAAKSLFERITIAEEALAEGDLAHAVELFESLYRARGALAEEERARVLVGWAGCVHVDVGLEEALAILSEARPDLESLDARRRLDRGAALLLESEELFERAADAYRGSY